MLNTLTRAALASLAFLGAGLVAPAFADINILVIDQERVLRQSVAGQDLGAQAQTLRDQIQQEVVAEQNSILSLQKDLEQNAKAMSPAQREQKARAFDARRQNYQAFEQKESQTLQASVGKAQSQIATALKPILQQLIDERKATILLDRQVIMYAVPSLDVSDEAIKRLNNVIKSVKLTRVDPTASTSRPPVAPGKPPLGIVKPN